MRKHSKVVFFMFGICLCLSLVLVSPGATESSSARAISIRRPGVIVDTTGIERKYGDAFAAILAEARRAYERTFGLGLPKTFALTVTCDPTKELRLWTDGESHLFLNIKSEDQLGSSVQTGVFIIYGLCHELGHIAMYERMKNLAGLPEGVGEGWAYYAGSVVVDEVARRLGRKVWPEPYDVAEAEGTARLKKQIENKDWADLTPEDRAAKVFYEIEKKYGRKTLGDALDKALARKPSGKEFMPFLVESLRKLTRDPTAADWIPEEALSPKTRWDVKERHVEENFFADQKTLRDGTGILLYYDDGSAEGATSSAGSGHAVLFRKPEGNWFLDRVDVFGSRYGMPQAPDEEFSVYVCDEDLEPILEVGRPYSLFERGERRWFNIPVNPVQVPERFYVCLSFNPTATRGIHVAYDENVPRSHSRDALPYSHVRDVPGKYDWMIRAHLRKGSGK